MERSTLRARELELLEKTKLSGMMELVSIRCDATTLPEPAIGQETLHVLRLGAVLAACLR